MKNKMRILSLLLVFVMLFTVLVACSDKTDEGAGGTSAAGTTEAGGTAGGDDPNGTTAGDTGPVTDENGYEVDNLPDMKWDDELNLFSWQNLLHLEFEAEGETGEPINDEVFRRKARLKDKYGITFNVSSRQGHWEERANFIKAVEANQSEYDDAAYDILGYYFAISGEMTVKGFFDDLSDESLFPYLDLEKPWWPADLLGTAKVNNAVYAATGHITPTFITDMGMTHVNLDRLAKYNGEDVNVYDLVRNKQWTYEKLEELALGKSFNTGADREYALTMANNVIFDRLFYSAGFTFINNLEDGSIALANIESDQRFLDFYDYCYRLLNENKDVALVSIGTQATATTAAGFQAGNAMFNFGTASDVQNSLTTVDFNFGILPMPMYNTADINVQKDYYTVQGFWTTLYSLPQNGDDKEFASFALEALASDGYRNMTPTWYDTMFKGRYLETPENAEMFDLIYSSVVFDAGRIFGTQINIFSAFRKASQTANWSSYYAAQSPTWKDNIDKVNEAFGSF